MRNKSSAVLLFLIGLLSTFRIGVVGQIGISEIFIFLVAPFLCLRDFLELKRDGFLRVIILTLLCLLGCFVSSLVNHTPVFNIIRGCAAMYSLFAGIVVFHRLLKDDMRSLKWLALGFGISFLAMLVSHGHADIVTSGVEAGAANNQAVYRLYAITPLLLCPIAGWYLRIPMLYSVGVPLLLAVFSMFSSASGRSTGLILMAVAGIALIGKKSKAGMVRIRRHFMFIAVAVLCGLWVFKSIYTHLALNGTLGAAAESKLLSQTKGKTDILSIIMGGRAEFFVGLIAAFDRPIFGHGPWAVDKNGYYEDFLFKYGNSEDYAAYIISSRKSMGYHLLPAHSHIIYFWHACGIVGLLFWVYVLCQVYGFFRKNAAAIPQWYGYVCAWAPMVVWAIFFSPFSERMQISALITVLLFFRAVAEGRITSYNSASYRRLVNGC